MNSLVPKSQNTDLATESANPILTAAQYRQLSDVPPAIEWFANIDNPQTRRAYENDLRSFSLPASSSRKIFAPSPVAMF
ncbi:MAG: hypothetical protein ABIR00_08245 [Nitrosospira sp.]